ncbi:unnamed protein product [Merluccius merluccius]
MADLPGARQERFNAEETNVLVRAVKDRQVALRRGKSKLADNNRTRRLTGGGSASTQDLTPAEDIAASTLTAESVEGFGGLEIGTQPVQPQASQEDDPGLGSSAHGPSSAQGPAEEGAAQTLRGRGYRRTTRRGSIVRPEDHPFLQLQQTGFDMLERELSQMRRINGRLDRVAMLLRPLRRISLSLERIAAAMERGPPNAPPPPVVPLPPPPTPSPSTRSRGTSRIATGPRRVQSRRSARMRGKNN